MFWAINKKTREKINSLTIQDNLSYQFLEQEEWYADPDEIENCSKDIDITKITVFFRKDSTKISKNGIRFYSSPSFILFSKWKKLGINTIPETIEHKLAKNFIYNRKNNKELYIIYSTINKPYKYHNKINLFDLDVDLEKIGIEVNSSLTNKTRRADVIIPLRKKHELLGLGIVFEIQFTAQIPTTKIDRELDWAIRGYSVCWLYLDDFIKYSKEVMDLREKEVKVDSYASLIKINNKEQIKNLKLTVQDLCRQVDAKTYELENKFNEILKKAVQGTEINSLITRIVHLKIDEISTNIQPKCPKCNLFMITKKGRLGTFWGCSNYPICKVTMQKN